MFYFLVFSLNLMVIFTTHVSVNGLDNGLARTPPMGWMTWAKFGCHVDCVKEPNGCISDKLIRSMASVMVTEGYLDAGYEYVNIDDCWSEMERDPVTQALVPNATRFPDGIENLSSFVHSLGLRFGIYGDIGTKTCEGYPGFWIGNGSASDYFLLDTETFASWGVDSIKVDGCYQDIDLFDRIYPRFGQALNFTGLEIYNQATMEVIDSTEFREELLGVSLQPFITLQPTISYSKLKLLPPLPTCRADIKISQSFAELENGSKFLFVDDGNEDKMLIFATEEFFQFLCNSDKVYMDGTFRTVPKLFYQLYTMHIMKNDLMIPVVYALLPNKQCDTYVRLFRHLQDAALQRGTVFSPDAFVIDFESGAISAIKGLFANSRIKCCRFHFAQCIWRKAQKLGLKSVYNEEEGKTKAIQRLMALPLVRPEHIDELFEHIIADCENDPQLDELFEYFYDNYFKEDARFKRDLWNSFDFDGPQTTNHVEGWHNALRSAIKISHPNLWTFIDKIKTQQKIFETKLLLQNSGTEVVRKRRKRLVQIERQQRLTQRYQNDELTPIEYLDRIKFLKLS